MFVPVCRQVPKIRIATKRAIDYVNMRIQVEIDAWDSTSKYPRGHYLKTLGPVGNIEADPPPPPLIPVLDPTCTSTLSEP